MQPLSPRVRVAYLMIFVASFALLLPLVIFYADGWRFSRGSGFYKTGGVYVSVPYANVTVSINGVSVGRSGILQRSFYIDDLEPSTYVLRAAGEGYYPWERMVVVEPQLVTDARVLLMPLEIEETRLALTGNATGTRLISEELYDEYVTLFSATTSASSTLPVDTSENVGLFIESGNLFLRLLNGDDPVPSVFCTQPSYCVSGIELEDGRNTTLSAAFFEGGVIYRTKEGGILFTEADIRPIPRLLVLYQKAGADFRIVNGMLIVKDGKEFYEISGL
jgi:hypothetical protein